MILREFLLHRASLALFARGAGYHFKKEAVDGHFDWAKPGTPYRRVDASKSVALFGILLQNFQILN